MPWHCRCIAGFLCWLVPTLVCLLALLLLLLAHGDDFGIGAAIDPAVGRQLKELAQHGLNRFTLAVRGGQHQATHGAQLAGQRLFVGVVGVQQSAVSRVFFPAQVPRGTEVVANVKRVVIHSSGAFGLRLAGG